MQPTEDKIKSATYQCRGSIIQSAKTCQLKILPNIIQSNFRAYAKPKAEQNSGFFQVSKFENSETKPFLLDDPLHNILLYLGCQDNIIS
jgi:hypothetical protein